MEARKEEEPTGGLQPSFGLEVENLLKAIDAVERLLHEAGEPGAVKLVEASNQIKQITATIQALAKLPESRTPANTATAAQLRHKTKHLVLWVKQLKLQHDQQQATNNAGGPASPGAAPKGAASPLSALGHLSTATRRTASLPQPPTAAAAPSNATTSPQSGVQSTLASSTSSSSSRPIRAATSSSPTTSPTLLIRNEFNLFSDTFSMPSARSSESTSFAPRSYLSGGDSDDPSPASSSPYAPPLSPQQQDKVRYREGDESMKPRHSAKEEEETESGTSEDLFTPSSPPADSTFYLIDAKGPGKDVHIPQHEGGDGGGGGKGRRDRSTSNHVKAGRMSGPAGARNPLCGWLHKSGNTFMSPWKRRYFVLDASERPLAVQQYSGFMTWGGGERRHNKTASPPMKQTLRLYYYISREDPVPKGFIDLALLEAIRPGVRYKNTFDITIANRVFHLKAETKEEADDWIWELRRWAEWARGRELAPNAREQQEKEERERKEKEEQDKAAASYRSRSASFPAEWFPKLADALLGKSEQAAVAPAPTAVQEEKKEEPRRRGEAEDKYKHGVAAAADARAKEVDTATQYEAKLQLMEEVVEYKERELWNMRREAEKRTGLNIDDCSVEELEELESELLKALVRIKTVKKKKAKEVRDSIKMDLLQLDVCRACFVNTRRVVFLPCGHFEVCEDCAEKASECHRCNRPIERRVEVRET